MSETFYKRRFEGARWRVVFDRYEGLSKFAIDELHKELQVHQPYVLPVLSQAQAQSGQYPHTEHEVLVGLVDRHGGLAHAAARGLVDVPAHPQGYAIYVGPHPAHEGYRLIAIAGRSEAGLLHGVMDFTARVMGENLFVEPPTVAKLRDEFEKLPQTRLSEKPTIDRRGVWTWGYPIYDYQRYLDNMARLRMNTLVMWNDHPPINARDIIDYAHSRGVAVIFGFHWGWGLTGLELGRPADRKQITDMVLENYDRNYAHLDVDGLYFQTLTETYATKSEGMSIAAAARELVNETAAPLLQRRAGMKIYFGLHASSIASDAHELATLDPRVDIMWEDAGGIPYQYNPTLDDTKDGARDPWRERWATEVAGGKTLEQCTLEYSRQIADIRPGSEFALVPKGWFHLRWDADFEHHGPMILGRRRRAWISDRLRERQPRWDWINSLWMQNLGLAAEFYRELAKGGRPMTVAGLIEDGMLEEAIQPSVAIFGQTMWNPYRSDKEILRSSLSRYYHLA